MEKAAQTTCRRLGKEGGSGKESIKCCAARVGKSDSRHRREMGKIRLTALLEKCRGTNHIIYYCIVQYSTV
eukprot:2125914-Heterocapsa_arctica.AAC.1